MANTVFSYKAYRNGRLFFIAANVTDLARKLKGMQVRRDLAGVTVVDQDGTELTPEEVLGE